MNGIFELGDSDRITFLRRILHSFGCLHVCLWLHVSPQSYLQSINGELAEASSSSGTPLISQLFDQYRRQFIFIVENDALPGLAFKQRNPFMVFRDFDLQRLSSSDVQRRFYLEAGIQTAVFMGCRNGEIELGFSTVLQANMEMELRKLFLDDFQSTILPQIHHSTNRQEAQQHQSRRPSPSSPVSLDSPEYPSFMYNIATLRQPPLIINQPMLLAQQHLPAPQQHFPTPECVDAVIASAMLATLSSDRPILPDSLALPESNQGGRIEPDTSRRLKRKGDELSAFKRCDRAQIARSSQLGFRASFERQNMMKKVISFYRGLNVRRLRQHHSVAQHLEDVSRPTSTQLHHVLNERKRREKINESFQALRSLLPPETKKDKASVLRATKEYMSSLKDQISQLDRKNKLLESQLASAREIKVDTDRETSASNFASSERFGVQLLPVLESSSEGRTMDLHATVQGDGSSILDLVIRLLEFLKGVREVRLTSIQAHELLQQQQRSTNRVTLRLVVIEGSDWDESAFLEAVKKVIADLSHFSS